MQLTRIQQELLRDRLGVADAVVESIAQTRTPDDHPAYDAEVRRLEKVLAEKCDLVDWHVREGGFTGVVLRDPDMVDIIADLMEGSTYFAAEDESLASHQSGGYGRDASWWARRHEAADQLEAMFKAATGRTVTFRRS